MVISRFTKRELDEFRRECNFTALEASCFELKAKNCSNVELSMKLNISDSTVSATMRSVRAKITAVLEDKASDKAKNPMPTMPTNPALEYLVGFLKTILADTPFIPESHTTKEWTAWIKQMLAMQVIAMDIEQILANNLITAIEAMFETDSFDKAIQCEFA